MRSLFVCIFVACMVSFLISTSGQGEMFLQSQGRYTEFNDTEAMNAAMPSGGMFDFIVNLISSGNFGPGQPDFLNFLRDPYPLPGGLNAPWAEYDYVIIGAGSAGSALASRLSEGGYVNILVLEAGRSETLLNDIPVISAYFQRSPYAWQYRTEQQKTACNGMEMQRCFWPRGRAVGGTSVINYMIYTRGRPEDWDRIAADGNPGWSYKNILPYYLRLERTDLWNHNDNPNKGHNGKVSIENVPFRTKLIEAFLEAGRLIGIPTVDYNAPNEIGLGYVQVTTTKGHRHSAAKAYLHLHKNRKNLHILPESRATKVIIDKKSKRATAVEFVRAGMKYTVKAKHEVIVSAGPIESPKLLMLSGIGPEDHLKTMNIPVIQNLNVGRTLYDHISFDGLVFTLNTSNILSLVERRETNVPNVLRWFHYGDGVLASPGGVEGIGYIKTDVPYEEDVLVDLELISIAGSIVSDGGGGVRRGMMIRDDVFNAAYSSILNTDTWSAFPLLLYPKSKGYLELKDKNPFSSPLIVHNYLTHPRDIATLVAGIKHVIKMGSSKPFLRYGAKLFNPNYPQCRQFPFNTDKFWECAVRLLTTTEHHQVATCKMGPHTDPDAVVDHELRVYGIENLRVVDSSILPRQTVAHTNGPAMMIGEKAADLIRSTWIYNYSENM